MAVAAVIAANMYNGFNTYSWNWWVLAGVLIGPVLIILYTAVYSAFKPSLIWTFVWGNNTFLWPSAYWWLGLIFTIILSLAPRYLYRFIKEFYFADDTDILRQMEKSDPRHDWIHDPNMPQPAVEPGHFEPAAAPTPDSASASVPIISRPSGDPGSYQLGRIRTEQSLTHDLSTGRSRLGTGSRYGFDEGVQLDVTRYTSRGSDRSLPARTRSRKGLHLNRTLLFFPLRLSQTHYLIFALLVCSIRSIARQEAVSDWHAHFSPRTEPSPSRSLARHPRARRRGRRLARHCACPRYDAVATLGRDGRSPTRRGRRSPDARNGGQACVARLDVALHVSTNNTFSFVSVSSTIDVSRIRCRSSSPLCNYLWWAHRIEYNTGRDPRKGEIRYNMTDAPAGCAMSFNR